MATNPQSEAHPADRSGSSRKSVTNRKSSTTSKPARTRAVSGRAAAQKVEEDSHIRLDLPMLGSVRLPEPQRLAYYAAIGALGFLGILDWPVALILAGGHALASDQHNRAVQQFGEALEDA